MHLFYKNLNDRKGDNKKERRGSFCGVKFMNVKNT